MAMNNFEINNDIRKQLKIIAAKSDSTMKDLILKTINEQILTDSISIVRSPRPKQNFGHLMLLIPEKMKHSIKKYSKEHNVFLRDIVMTAIIYIILEDDDTYEIPTEVAPYGI